MEIEVQIEDLDPSSEQIADRPTTTKRTVKTNAIVRNGKTIILGGLIKRTGGVGISSVPYLSEIPVLGDLLFTHHSDIEREQNVVIYLTPYIVRKSGDLEKLKNMLAELDEVQARYNKLVEKALGKNTSEVYEEPSVVSSSSVPASNRIRRTHQDNLDLLNGTEEF